MVAKQNIKYMTEESYYCNNVC